MSACDSSCMVKTIIAMQAKYDITEDIFNLPLLMYVFTTVLTKLQEERSIANVLSIFHCVGFIHVVLFFSADLFFLPRTKFVGPAGPILLS